MATLCPVLLPSFAKSVSLLPHNTQYTLLNVIGNACTNLKLLLPIVLTNAMVNPLLITNYAIQFCINNCTCSLCKRVNSNIPYGNISYINKVVSIIYITKPGTV